MSPRLGIDHYIIPLGVVNNEMQSPDADGNYAVAWYPQYGKPGDGNAVFSAHETWNKMQGPFYYTHRASTGNEIYLDMADGTRHMYQVISLTRYSVDAIPMADVLWPGNRPAGEEWITLITCGGRIVYTGSYGDYIERDVLVAKWVK